MKKLIFKTDSYKFGHWQQTPDGTEVTHSYFESRKGARFSETVFFGLQYILKNNFLGQVVDQEAIDDAYNVASCHFGNPTIFNKAGWEYILNKHGGRLPLRVRAVAEGTPVPVSNVLMTVENTDDKCEWLTNDFESLLTHAWAPSTVATLSREVKKLIKIYLDKNSDNQQAINFMLHDFGYRGVSSDESAEVCGAAHLVNFLGTDTLLALITARDYYNADLKTLAFSVPASEHRIMTALGKDGEAEMVKRMIQKYPSGIISVVGDSYDIYNFVSEYVCKLFKQNILNRSGVFVVRPDSISDRHPTPQAQVVWILDALWEAFGGTINSKGYKVLDSHVRVLWGDGIDYDGIDKILLLAHLSGYSAENLVFGMGGGLLQKINRDTQRFAFKCCAQKINGVWSDVFKSPRDQSKASKMGRLKLFKYNGSYQTERADLFPQFKDELITVFENGELVKEYTFNQVRDNARL